MKTRWFALADGSAVSLKEGAQVSVEKGMDGSPVMQVAEAQFSDRDAVSLVPVKDLTIFYKHIVASFTYESPGVRK